MNIEEIKELMDNFDPATLLPDLSTVMGKVELAMRILVLVGPIILLVLGVLYFFAAPREANHYFGYRSFFGMGSVEAWQFSQRLAGIVWAALGLVLTVVMLVLSSGFQEMEIMDAIWKAVRCLAWQVGLVLLSCIGINLTLFLRFNHKGERRNLEWAKKK